MRGCGPGANCTSLEGDCAHANRAAKGGSPRSDAEGAEGAEGGVPKRDGRDSGPRGLVTFVTLQQGGGGDSLGGLGGGVEVPVAGLPGGLPATQEGQRSVRDHAGGTATTTATRPLRCGLVRNSFWAVVLGSLESDKHVNQNAVEANSKDAPWR